MTYLIIEILVCLLLAAVIGFLVGWLWARAAGRARLESIESDWAGRFGSLERDRDEWRRKADEALGSLQSEKQAVQQLSGQLNQGQGELEAAKTQIGRLAKDVDDWRQKAAAGERVSAERLDLIAGKDLELGALKDKLAVLQADLGRREQAILAKEKDIEALGGRIGELERDLAERFAALERERDDWHQKAEEALGRLQKEQQTARQLGDEAAQGRNALDAARDRMAKLTKDSEERLAAEQKAHRDTRQALEEAQAELDERGRRMAAFTTEVEKAKSQQASLQALVDQRAAAFADQERQLGAIRERVADLHADLGKRNQRILELEKDLDRLRRRVVELEGELARRDQRLQEASQTLSSCQLDLTSLAEKSTFNRQELTGVIEQLKGRVGELAPALAARQEEVARLARELADWEKRYEQRVEELTTCEAAVAAGQKIPANILLKRPEEVDDIKEIRGIGPVLERVLNRLGIYLFRQIAEFTPEDVDWVASNLPEFSRRIIWEGWVEQARELQARKYGAR
jgi:predicted flap endonuclease-1-like 5' DNA nuclease